MREGFSRSSTSINSGAPDFYRLFRSGVRQSSCFLSWRPGCIQKVVGWLYGGQRKVFAFDGRVQLRCRRSLVAISPHKGFSFFSSRVLAAIPSRWQSQQNRDGGFPTGVSLDADRSPSSTAMSRSWRCKVGWLRLAAIRPSNGGCPKSF